MIYSHKTKIFKSIFYCYVHQFTYQNTTLTHYLEDFQFFSCFYHFIFVAVFCYLVEEPIHAFCEQVKYCLFLHCFDMLVEKTKELMYQKWNRALLVDLIWTCGQHVLFCYIFVCFCLHCAAHKS